MTNKEQKIKNSNRRCPIRCAYSESFVCCIDCSHFNKNSISCDDREYRLCTLLRELYHGQLSHAIQVWKKLDIYYCSVFLDLLSPRERRTLIASLI